MSDYEKINANVKVQLTARRKAAIWRIVRAFGFLLVALVVIACLNTIGFISMTFAIILAAISVCVCAFKTGYIWHDIKF